VDGAQQHVINLMSQRTMGDRSNKKVGMTVLRPLDNQGQPLVTQSSASGFGVDKKQIAPRSTSYAKRQKESPAGEPNSSSRAKEPEDEIDMLLESYAIHEDIPSQKQSILHGKTLQERGPAF